MFQIGDKVVCVDDRFPDSIEGKFNALPQQDRVYVVRESYTSPKRGEPSVRLIGIVGTFCAYWGCEYGFRAYRFRKLEDLKNDARERQRKEEPTTA